MTSQINDPIVYVYCPIVCHQILCKNYFKYNNWNCNCHYNVMYIRNYIHCSQVVNEYDLLKCDRFNNISKSDIKNYNIYLDWRERNHLFQKLDEFL